MLTNHETTRYAIENGALICERLTFLDAATEIDDLVRSIVDDQTAQLLLDDPATDGVRLRVASNPLFDVPDSEQLDPSDPLWWPMGDEATGRAPLPLRSGVHLITKREYDKLARAGTPVARGRLWMPTTAQLAAALAA